MRTLTVRSLSAAATLAVAMGVGAMKEAHAYAYAYSDLEVTNGLITVIPIGTTTTNQFGACLAANCAFFAAPTPTSESQATLAGFGTASASATNALVSIGPGSTFPDATAPVDNTWVLEGSSPSVSYTWADSQVISQQTLGFPLANPDGTPNVATYLETHQIAEGNSNGPLGTSGGITTSSTSLVTTLNVFGNGARVRFDLDVLLDMLAEIAAPSTGILAQANANIGVSIRNSSGSLVFDWNVGSDPLGASAFFNDFAFTNVSLTSPGSQAVNESGSFFAVTNNLAAGTYQLSLTAQASERVQSIPEPGSLVLFGVALLGLFGSLRARGKLSF